MNCPKCGTDLNRSYLREDGFLVCPGCNTVYRRKKQDPLPKRAQVRKTIKKVSLPISNDNMSNGQIADEAHLNFELPAFLSAVMAMLCFLRTYELAWDFLCIIGSILLVLYALKINSTNPAFVIIPVACVLLKEVVHSTQWQGFWLTVAMLFITAVIWAGDNHYFPLGSRTKSNLEMIRYLISIVTVLVCIFFLLKIIVGSTSYSSLVISYHFGLLCIATSLAQIFGPWEKRSGKMKGSLLLVAIGIYAAALALGAIGFAMSDSLSNVVNTYQFGKNLIGGYADYALQQFGGMSKFNLYLMFGCAVAFICESFGLILVNFRICRKAESFFYLFILDAVLIIFSLLIILISTEKYLVAGIVVPILIVTTVILTRYFSFSPTVQKYFDYD